MTQDANAEVVKGQTEEQLAKDWDQVKQDRQEGAPHTDAEPVVEAQAADPLAGLPEPTRKLIEGLKKQVDDGEGRFKDMGQKLATAHGTIGNIKQRLDASQAEVQRIKPLIKTVEDAEKVKTDQAKQAKATAVTELRERLADFPDFLAYMDIIAPPADAKPAAATPVIETEAAPQAETKPVTQDPQPTQEVIDALRESLEERCPGWEAKRRSKEFNEWFATQADEVKARLESWKVKDSASVIEAFDKHVKDSATVAAVSTDRQERLRRGGGMEGRGGSQADGAGDPDSLWNKVKGDRKRERAGGIT